MIPSGVSNRTAPVLRAGAGIRQNLVIAFVSSMVLLVVLIAILLYSLDGQQRQLEILGLKGLEETQLSRQFSNDGKALLRALRMIQENISKGNIDTYTAEQARVIKLIRSEVAQFRRVVLHSVPELTLHFDRLEEVKNISYDQAQLRGYLNNYIEAVGQSRQRKLRIDEAFSIFFGAALRVEVIMRAKAAKSLSIDILDAAQEGKLEPAVDEFVEQELSWLGTAQKLQTDSSELHRIATKLSVGPRMS